MAKRARADLFSPVTTRSTVRNVVDQIVDHLRTERVGAGEFLPSERSLATAMRVSRRTIREAVRRLAEANDILRLEGMSGAAASAPRSTVALHPGLTP